MFYYEIIHLIEIADICKKYLIVDFPLHFLFFEISRIEKFVFYKYHLFKAICLHQVYELLNANLLCLAI